MRDPEEEKYLFRLCSVRGLGLTTLRLLMQHFKSAGNLYRASDEELLHTGILREKERMLLIRSRDAGDWEKEWEAMQQKGIRFLSYFHEEYPEVLRHIYQPPKKLMVKGRMPDPHRISVSIVGARECTAYGRDIARLFGCRLARAGIQIISGMALGIDGWGHQGALEGGGETFAVLGSGVDVCYPARHRALYESIQKHGGLLSEFPAGAKAHPQYFPMRNRIISGLSHGILIVEARERSGSLITVDAALEQGKEVFVIPGRIGDELSGGCNRLIRQGAIPVLSPEDILEYYSVMPESQPVFSGIDQRIFEYIGEKPVYVDELQKHLQIPSADLLKGIFRLQGEGLIREVAKGFYIKKI